MDKIEIRDLEIFANHGVFPEETALGQKFVVSAVMYTETRPAGLTDDLSASINYGEVSHMITDFLQKNTYKLLEAAVENLAEMLLLSLPLLKKITLRIEKPWAPVGLPLKTVAVEITRGWHTAYIAFGSNMGDKKKYLDNAIQGLRDMKEIVVEKVSEYLVTEPYGDVEQDEFLNGALRVRTLLLRRSFLTGCMCWNRLRTGKGSFTGDQGHWIWISCFMIRKLLICQIFIFLILICTTAILFLYQ